jgi:hypothetical protein
MASKAGKTALDQTGAKIQDQIREAASHAKMALDSAQSG